MRDYVIVHIPHSSLYIPSEYKNEALIGLEQLEEENLFMCDMYLDKLFDNKTNVIVFPYSRLYCDVERFRDDREVMNKFGMGYIYTKTSLGEEMFQISDEHKAEIDMIYDAHHDLLNEKVTEVLEKYGKCILIDLHSYSSLLVERLFNYEDLPDICIGIENDYADVGISEHIINCFRDSGYSVAINYPYSGSIIPNKFIGVTDSNLISIMIEINRRVFEKDLPKVKRVLRDALKF